LADVSELNIEFDPALRNQNGPDGKPIPAVYLAQGATPRSLFEGVHSFVTNVNGTTLLNVPSLFAGLHSTMNEKWLMNEKWKKIIARHTMQLLLDKSGWQLTRIPGNPILRVVGKKA
jgi:hypothetical protein